MEEYVKKSNVYSLFDRSGTARLHVADIDVIPAEDVAPVVFCRKCAHHGRCQAEKIYLSENIAEPFCCRGKPKGGEI